jgi:hypothetical protein
MPAGTTNTAAAASAASTTSIPAKYSFVCTFFNQLLGCSQMDIKTKFIPTLF